ncbi:CASP8-associated protein 2 isoform X2 [Mugil cephalus]|uniref:CASP8-associated protein 2 isoform X2 n=1 Tax=Mugil cephalus TaxID=48193 RepID=UPI001FB801B7|nr:CASP8-associated protein 2 isoform X2 [Mugil cephalus]
MAKMDTSDASGPLAHDEDSVDLYDDLDIGFNSNADKSPTAGSELKESMDLYEDLVTEEQQSRESSYTALKSRFQAAQNQIKELRQRLEQMELQNTGLSTENHRLKKNISALLQTARQEVMRKDAEIQRLNQRSDKDCHHHHSNSRPSTFSHTKRPPPPLPSIPPPPLLPPPAANLGRDHPPRDPAPVSEKESNSFTRTSKASSHSYSKRDCEVSDKQMEPDKHKSRHREEKYQNLKLSESTDKRHRSCSDPKKDCHAPEKSRTHRADKDTRGRYDSRSSKSRIHQDVERLRRSDGVKTSSPEVFHSAASSDDKRGSSRERRQDKYKMTGSDSECGTTHSSKEGYSREHRKVKTSDRHSRSSDTTDRKKSNQHTERNSDSSKEREGDRRKDQRKDNPHEVEISKKYKVYCQKETSREQEKQRPRESDQKKADGHIKGGEEGNTLEALKISSEEPSTGEKNSVEENSPHRKLSFMETLNLTLSPIKKPVLPIDGIQDNLIQVDDEVGPDEENSQPNIEDMCVIDDINNSELAAGSGDAADQSPDHLIVSSTEKRKFMKDVKEKENSLSETLRVNNLAQTTSPQWQPLATTENKMTVHLALKSPESRSLKSNISKNHDDKTKLVSASQEAVCALLEAKDGTENDRSGSNSKQHISNDQQKSHSGNNTDLSTAVAEPVVPNSSEGSSKNAVSQSISLDSPTEDVILSHSKDINVSDEANANTQQLPLTVQPQVTNQGLFLPASSSSIHEKDCRQDGPKDTDAVSSTISLESLPQEGLSLTEAIYVLTQTDEDADGSTTAEPSSSVGCIGVSKVSSTTEEKTLPERFNNLIVTPKKNFSPGKRRENNVQSSSSVPLLHDEDSMMRTLSNLKKIPDAISPLRSPIRITKRSLLHVHGKPGHVKSLQKEFSCTAVDGTSKKLDVNKENKYPGSPAKSDAHNPPDKVSDRPSGLSDTDLEEGEIVSESDEAATCSPVPATKRAKLEQPPASKPSPKSLLKRKSEEKRVASTGETAGVSTRSPKSRFKTVCPTASKTSFSNIEEIMETFKRVRTEIRKKYMKLHKTFPKKSFYGVMDNFQESFLEFVDGAHFGQVCSQVGELKSKLKNLIASVFKKISNNGIVKRIFEQQAVDLKQKLWDFVDVQVDYLFRDVHTALSNLCKPTSVQVEDKKSIKNEKVTPPKKPRCQKSEAKPSNLLSRTKCSAVAPYKTGLGSRGKDIRITQVEKERNADWQRSNYPKTPTVEFLPPKKLPSTPVKNNMSSLVVSQNGSLLDKTDFELLTEQQASTLTFTLARDSQMGEIFKCLLQGTDLLESSGINGDNSGWSLGTPRKDGERFISITTPSKFDSSSTLVSPNKFDSPSKLIATWSSISPRKMLSPRSKGQIPPNPAFFDESCLLEVPSDNRALLQASTTSQKTYSILAEDLAVSLTIPSPLKSDSHLSFLQPSSMSIRTPTMSTPDSVISAHISEDALLDGEDATEQDIHLALDTDNSSRSSSSSLCSGPLTMPFVLKPDMPMQALVMERSNDHFIVKIRQASTDADVTLTANDSLSRTLTEEDQHVEDDIAAQEEQAKATFADKSQKGASLCSEMPSQCSSNKLSDRVDCTEICEADTASDTHPTLDERVTITNNPSSKTKDMSPQHNASKDSLSKDSLLACAPSDDSLNNNSQSVDHFSVTAGERTSQAVQCQVITSKNPSTICESQKANSHVESSDKQHQQSQTSQSQRSHSGKEEIDMSESERSLTISEDMSSSPEKELRDCDKGKKRKKCQQKSKVKRSRKEDEESAGEMVSSSGKEDESRSPPASLSPNSLSAKNVIRKKGEVVIAWTRDEDRAILIYLKAKGASRETFSALSEKLNKPSGKIAQRFAQLMKLFKAKEKMDV